MTDRTRLPSARARGIRAALFENKVIALFVVLCVACVVIADTSVSYVAAEVFTRFGRNTCLVLALIIPCLAGLGMNFGIVVGAMAAQIAIFWVVHWGFTGVGGFALSALLCTPLALLFGWLLGRLYNKTKGSEMIAGLVLGFFAAGVYRLFVLYIIGGVIPFDDPNLLPRGFGLRNAFDLTGNLKYALDDLSFLTTLQVLFAITAVTGLVTFLYERRKGVETDSRRALVRIAGSLVLCGLGFALRGVPLVQATVGGTRFLLVYAARIGAVCLALWAAYRAGTDRSFGKKRLTVWLILAAVLLASSFVPALEKIYRAVRLPAFTYGVICLFCFFNNWLLGTKLGQDMRTVGQSRAVATSAGLDVDKTRVIATCISTVLAAWGQLIFLQNLGTFNTVQQQDNVGLYAVAAILVGGANVQKATNKQAVIGVFLFHTLFVVAPLAATKIVGDSAISEYIRMFISYGVIAVSLAMHAWKKVQKTEDGPEENPGAPVLPKAPDDRPI